MTETARVFSWDWKRQPDMAAIAAAVTEMSASGRVFMREIDTGGDNYAWVISDAELTDGQAWRAYAGEAEGGTGETAMEVSGHAGDWTPEQVRLVSTYGTCRACGAPRTSVAEERVPGSLHMSLACLNGHGEGDC